MVIGGRVGVTGVTSRGIRVGGGGGAGAIGESDIEPLPRAKGEDIMGETDVEVESEDGNASAGEAVGVMSAKPGETELSGDEREEDRACICADSWDILC